MSNADFRAAYGLTQNYSKVSNRQKLLLEQVS